MRRDAREKSCQHVMELVVRSSFCRRGLRFEELVVSLSDFFAGVLSTSVNKTVDLSIVSLS